MENIVTTLAGRYEITRRLGRGGFAITLLARDIMQPSKPLCVVKQLRPNRAHPRVIEFFHKEAKILEKLGKHPQVPQLLAHFQEGENLYIVQEFIAGHDLSKEIFPGKRLSEAYVRKLLKDVVEILSFVHQYGVIHRDIKPQNLMRRQVDGRIFLIDFGAVKELGTLVVNTRGEVASSVIIGTPGYMPNEQNLGKACLASDVYALGMTAIAALTGVKPIELEENPETGEVLWLQRAQVSAELGEVISKMVRRHFSLRYSCATDLLQELSTPTQLLQKSSVPSIIYPTISSVSTPTRFLTSPSIINFWKRRQVIKILGLVGGGFITAMLGHRILQGAPKETSNENNDSKILEPENPEKLKNKITPKPVSKSAIVLKSFGFEVVTVNAKGDIADRQILSANYFTEYLGNNVTLDMVQIPGGEFFMGSPADEEKRSDDESPLHKVTIKPFFIGKFPITQAQYQAIMGDYSSGLKSGKHPAESLSWNNANEFCQRLTEKTGREYRLPSEAEWEYACRAQTTTPFHFGETITTKLVNYDGNYTYADAPKGEFRNETTEVGSFPPNAFGLYDVHGNIREWCQDTWQENYKNAPNDGSAWIEENNNTHRVLRGGSWSNLPAYCRSAFRYYDDPNYGYEDFGMRVICSI
ncbi:protein kinase [Mastigocoleus testarum BC008]|uniref:Protein kinase n=1 Tax=Mastigocoleus testarum BC008 TaxID=371196 RepID=A0A0V7ZYG1_9CYAN|nr:protein kinase [Mastigocoleus testarum BC008]